MKLEIFWSIIFLTFQIAANYSDSNKILWVLSIGQRLLEKIF